MHRSKKIFLGKCAAVLFAPAAILFAYAGGPDVRKTGAPGDTTCSQSSCHLGTAVNGGGGNVSVTFSSGTTYTLGQKITVTVKITDSVAKRYGFQASARPASEPRNTQAGTFTPGAQQQVLCNTNIFGDNRPASGICPSTGPLEFIEHSSPFTTNTITFTWTAPTTDVGPVNFYVAANAANGNGSETGDHIYTTTATLTKAANANSPTIADGGVGDGFTFVPGTAENTWTAIFGTNLSTTTRTWDDSDFNGNSLPTSLDGVSVKINNKPAFVYFVSPGQINVLAPADATTGPVSVVVTNANGQSNAMTVNKTPTLPAFYAPFAKDGNLYVTAVNPTTGDLIGSVGVDPRAIRGVKPGEVISLFGTGFGPTNPAATPDQKVTSFPPVTTVPVVRFGNTQATVLGAVLRFSGEYQINVTVPTTLSDGDVPLTAQIGSATSSSKVMITIQSR
jgi:uncharacterized protein (TIGR03437 family)